MPLWSFVILLAVVIPLVLLWVFTLRDVFKREDLHGPATVMWVLVIILLPFLGMVIYFVTRPPTPMEQPVKKASPPALKTDADKPEN